MHALTCSHFSQTGQGLAVVRLQPFQLSRDRLGRGRRRLSSFHLQRVRRRTMSRRELVLMVCVSHPSVYLDRIAHEDSTSNLLRHVRTCEPPETPESETLAAFASGATYSKAKYRYLLALWCARRHRPFSIVEDPEFRRIVRMLYARAETPSRISVSRDIQHLLGHARTRLIARLGVCSIVVIMSVARMFMPAWDPGAPVQGPPLRGWLDISKLYVVPGGYGALGGGQRARARHARFHQVSFRFFSAHGIGMLTS